MSHGVGCGHGFDHEGGCEVGHEGEHHDEAGAEGPSGVAERGRQREGARAHDQVEDVDEPGRRRVEGRPSSSSAAAGARSVAARGHGGRLGDPYLRVKAARQRCVKLLYPMTGRICTDFDAFPGEATISDSVKMMQVLDYARGTVLISMIER